MLARFALAAVVASAATGVGVRTIGGAYLCPDGLLCLASPVGLDDPRLVMALLHRAMSILATVAVVATAVRHLRGQPVASALAGVAVLAQPIVGVGVERMLLDPTWVAAHLALSLLTAGSLAALAFPRGRAAPSMELAASAALWAAVGVAAAVSATGAVEACTGWPLCRAVEGSSLLVDGARALSLVAFGLLAAVAIRRGRAARAQVVLRLCGLMLGADLAVFATGGAAEFVVAHTVLLHVAVAGAWWLLPASGWLVADRPATSPLPTPAPRSGAPTT